MSQQSVLDAQGLTLSCTEACLRSIRENTIEAGKLLPPEQLVALQDLYRRALFLQDWIVWGRGPKIHSRADAVVKGDIETVANYRGYDILDAGSHFLLIKHTSWDFEQCPFESVDAAKHAVNECLDHGKPIPNYGCTVEP